MIEAGVSLIMSTDVTLATARFHTMESTAKTLKVW